MPIRRDISRRAQQGFTMIEVLGVVAILAVVFAIAVPNIVQVQKSMGRMELTAKAEQVYNAVQYRLTALQSAGRLDELVGQCESLIPSQKLTSSAALPSDPTEKKYGLYLAGNDSNIGASLTNNKRIIDEYLLPPEDTLITQDVTPGGFYIEFSPQTGEVYSVFYWEDGNPKNYATLSAARTDPAGLSQLNVGYYGGGKIEGATEISGSSAAAGGGSSSSASSGPAYGGLQNEEELYIRVAGNNLASMDPSKLSVTLTITEIGNDGKLIDFATNGWQTTKWQHTFTGQSSRVQFSSTEIDIILDSMYDDADHAGKTLSFEDLLATYPDGYIAESNENYSAHMKSISPGANIRVNLRVEYNGSEVPLYDYDTYIANGTVIQQNSWDVSSAYDSYDPESGRVELACMRHFNNLRHNLVTFDYNGVNYQTIAITNTINFDGTQWWVSSVALSHRGPRASDPSYDLNPLSRKGLALEPIDLAEQYKTAGMEFVAENDANGKPFTLRNFVIGKPPAEGASADSNRAERESMEDTALFKATGKVNLRNIVLENPRVYGGKRTAALVAYVENGGGSMEGCKVVGGIVDGTEDVGGVVAYANTIPLSGLSAAVNVSGDKNVGGLLGHGFNNTGENGASGISGCSVNPLKDNESGAISLVTVTGSENVGGFVGIQEGGSIGDSYAICNVSGVTSRNGAAPSSTGGFVGLGAGVAKFTRCQTHAVVNGDIDNIIVPVVSSSGESVGGFAGTMKDQSGTEDSSAAVTVRAADSSSSNARYYGGFVGTLEGYPVNERSYASGPVSAHSHVGGFVGRLINTNGLSSCYTTSNVSAYQVCGGFAGQIESTSWGWQNDYAYGEVSMISGGDGSSFGGFFGNSTVSLGNRLTDYNCDYLKMNGYNDGLANNDVAGQPGGRNFGQLASGGATAAQSHPYAAALQGEPFPFGLVGGQDHYGDWPQFGAGD